jgi:hypothetical protein
MTNGAKMKYLVIAAIAAAFGITQSVSAAPVMIVRCAAATGVNIAADTEADRPNDYSLPEVYDPPTGAYVSHPRKTQSHIINVNQDGTATDTSFSNDGSSSVEYLRVVGSIDGNAISLISGKNGDVNLYTLYPSNSVVMMAGTSYFGWHKGIPIAFAYISHCQFSNVIQ